MCAEDGVMDKQVRDVSYQPPGQTPKQTLSMTPIDCPYVIKQREIICVRYCVTMGIPSIHLLCGKKERPTCVISLLEHT